MSKIGLTAFGAYIPYNAIDRQVIGSAWGTRGAKGERSIANSDEDSITLAVSAALESLRFINSQDVGGLYFASTTGPYTEKSQATLISTVLDLKQNVEVADFGSSLRASTSALKAAYAQVKAGLANNVLVTAADVRNAYPKSVQEQSFGDAGASLTVGNKDVFATIDAVYSYQMEIVDMWRNSDDQFVRNAEGRFALEEGYLSSMSGAIKGLLEENNLSIEDISTFVLANTGYKDAAKLAKTLKIEPEKVADDYINSVGIAGTAQTFLGLVGALEKANEGDRILLVSYGNGADAILLTVTEEIEKVKQFNSIQKYLDNRNSFKDYGRFLSFRGLIEANPGDDFKIPSSTAQTWREQETYLKLYGSHCNHCGTHTFPQERICPSCLSVDDYTKSSLKENVVKLFTYSIDNLAGRSDDPVIVQSVVEDENKTRVYLNMTDFNKEDVAIDMELEFTFRKIHNQGNFVNYYWKVQPLRRKKG